MKNLLRIFTLCTFIATLNAYADEGGATKPQYPLIEKYAPEPIKKVCLSQDDKEGIIIPENCYICGEVEKILWCARKQAHIIKDAKDDQKYPIYQYCKSCFEDGGSNEGFTMKLIAYLTRKEHLNHDEAFELLIQFNNAVICAKLDTKPEKE